MRVLLVSHTYLAPINWAKPLALARRTPLTVITPRRWRETLSAHAPQATPAYLHPLPVVFEGRALRHFYSPRQLIALLKVIRPELVHVEEEPPSLVLAEFAILKKSFGYRLTCFTWENLRVPRGLARAAERFSLSQCAGLVAGNTEAAQLLRQRGFTAPMEIIPQLGVDPDEFFPPSHSPARLFTVGFFGRLVPEKGVWVLLEAIRALPETNLLLVGSGPLEAEIAAWIKQSALTERIRLVPAVAHQAIPAKLREIDALALPSLTSPRWKEQFGHILIEAMAAGVPVIGSDSGAIPDVIGEAGIVVPEGNVAALRGGLARLAADSAQRARLAKAGRTRVLAHYTHEHIAAQTMRFWEQVAKT